MNRKISDILDEDCWISICIHHNLWFCLAGTTRFSKCCYVTFWSTAYLLDGKFWEGEGNDERVAKFQKLHETDEYLYMCMNKKELESGKKKNKPRILLDAAMWDYSNENIRFAELLDWEWCCRRCFGSLFYLSCSCSVLIDSICLFFFDLIFEFSLFWINSNAFDFDRFCLYRLSKTTLKIASI